MAVSERQRHALHEWARTAASEEVAETLMELLPPVGWADVATKRDLDHLEARLEVRFERMDARFDRMEARLGAVEDGFGAVEDGFGAMEGRLLLEVHRELRQHTYWIMAALWAAVGVAVGLSQAL